MEALRAARWTGSPRTDADSASFAISQKDGGRPTGSWRCGTNRSPSRRNEASPSSFSCSTHRNTAIAAMLAYNLNCWLMLFNREEEAKVETLKHTTLATARLRFLFLAAKIWRHAGRVGVSYSDHYAEQGIFRRLMDRLRAIATNDGNASRRCWRRRCAYERARIEFLCTVGRGMRMTYKQR